MHGLIGFYCICILRSDYRCWWSLSVKRNIREFEYKKTHGQERLFRKITSVSIHSFVEWLDTFSYVLRPADVTVKEVSHIRCFAIDIAKDLILLSCRLAMEHLCVLQLEKALATLVTTRFTLADRRWRSRYRRSDQCILSAFRSPERYNAWFRAQLGQRFTFVNFCPMMTNNAWNIL